MKLTDFNPHLKQGAGCVLFVPEDRKFLLIQRSMYVASPLEWCFPGGSIDHNEHPKDAAIREVMEETKIDISKKELKLIYKNETDFPNFIFHTYACILEKEVKPVLNWESNDYMWCTIDELPADIHEGVEMVFNDDRSAEVLKQLINQEESS